VAAINVKIPYNRKTSYNRKRKRAPQALCLHRARNLPVNSPGAGSLDHPRARGGDIRFNSRMTGGARDQAALLPLAPGVYRFRDATGRVLYLGRATSLRSRVASYWGDLGDRAHLSRMMARVARRGVTAGR
jgi:hypothetical protein